MIAATLIAATGGLMDAEAASTRPIVNRSPATYVAATFKDVPGWSNDQHDAALAAFRKSCGRLIVLSRTDSTVKADAALLALCVKVAQLAGSQSRAEARAFFERHFVPHRVVHEAGKGLLTAYYEPIVEGSRTPTQRFPWPLYKRPPELVTLVDEAHRGAIKSGLSHARQTDKGLVPFATRAEIEQGALKGQGLELLYVEHAVDAFFMQIQGSARVKLTDGSMIRIGYDGKNGHPYTSIGRVLIDRGVIPVERMSLQALQTWLKANMATGREVMWANKSFVFFREHAVREASGPQGVHDVTLTPGRSLAIDPSFHALGLPIYVTAPEIRHIDPNHPWPAQGRAAKPASGGIEPAPNGFHRLMIAQDVGSAIKGPERGDIYVGSGDKAGRIAGTTKHPGNFFVLLPRAGVGPSAPGQVAPGPVATGAAEPLPWASSQPSLPATPAPSSTPTPVSAPAALPGTTAVVPDAGETVAIKPAADATSPDAAKTRPPTSEPTTPAVADQLKSGMQ